MGRSETVARMSASPALRCSPVRDVRVDSDKHGRSLESGILFREKDDDDDDDDDLALFNEMQSKEQDNFLLCSTDDFEDTFSSKLRYFSEHKLGISVPSRGESSDLLNAEGSKNDYDWLLTPPDTPLFPSLDDDAPPVSTVQRGRTLSQPIKILRSSTLEKSYRSSRGSASPQRLSPSPRTGSNQAKGRLPSPPLSIHSTADHVSPSRKRSPTPSKPSTPVRRSSTPTPPRMSTGSSGNTAFSRARGTSPVTTTRGKSESPKISAWHSTIPGFPSEVPPNLRTSLGEQKPTYVRGSSPASRNSRDSSSKFTRKSMSPTASRSGSSLHSQERDLFSSNSKGSVASSGDEDADSLQSFPIDSSDNLSLRRVGTLSTSKAFAYKKPNRMISPSSAPKRSFDHAMRQMDHKKAPQNMFRPLLSSVPASTFYAGKVNSSHRTIISRNSSIGTSSTGSSDQGMSEALDTERDDHIQDDMTSYYGKETDPDIEEEVFIFDRTEELEEDRAHDTALEIAHVKLSDCPANTPDHVSVEDPGHTESASEVAKESSDLDIQGDILEIDSLRTMLLCSSCGCSFSSTQSVEMDAKLCPDCRREDRNQMITTSVASRIDETSSVQSQETLAEYVAPDKPDQDPVGSSSEFLKITNVDEIRLSPHEEENERGDACIDEQSQVISPDKPPLRLITVDVEQGHAGPPVSDQSIASYRMVTSDCQAQFAHSSNSLNSHIGVSEGAGISILLKRSSSSKGPLLQGRILSSTMPYGDNSYTRESTNSLRSSIGHGSASASSSIDLTSARQMETRTQRQSSGKRFNMENYNHGVNLQSENSGSFSSGTLNHNYQASIEISTHEETSEWSLGNKHSNVMDDTPNFPEVDTLEDQELDDMLIHHSEELNSEGEESPRRMDASTSDMSNIVNGDIEDNSEASNWQDSLSSSNIEDLPKHRRSSSNIEASAVDPDSHKTEDHMLLMDCRDDGDLSRIPLDLISEIETEENQSTHDSETSLVSEVVEKSADESNEPSHPIPSDKDLPVSIPDVDPLCILHGTLEDSKVMIEGQRGSKARSLTLEEATDAILFCSSIVHDLAYQAANIAIEKENSVALEGSRPTVTVLGKASPEKRNPRGRNPNKHTPKYHKAREMHVETENRNPSDNNAEINEKANETYPRSVGLPNPKVSDTNKPPKLESKCNCTIM